MRNEALVFEVRASAGASTSGRDTSSTARAQARVLIPARNEESTIGSVVQGCRRSGFAVTVIDDGSRDQTEALARQAGAEVIAVTGPYHGKTIALRQGLLHLANSVAWIFCLDGDGQHCPADLPRFWEAREGADMIVGNRFPDSVQMPPLRRWTNRAMSAALRRSGIRDSQCGFRLIRRAWLGGWLPAGHHFQFETELALLASARPCRVLNLPIAAIYARERSKIRPGRDTLNFAKCLYRSRRAPG